MAHWRIPYSIYYLSQIMSLLHLKQVQSYIEKTFANHIDVSDAKNDTEKTKKIITRGLVGLSLMKLEETTPEDAAKRITDGTKDNGIDCIHFSKTSNAIYLIQGKWSDSATKTIETGDLHKFIKGCKDLINGRWEKFNKKANSLRDEIEAALESPSIKIFLVLTYPSINQISNDCQEIVSDFLAEYNNPTELFFFKEINLTGLLSVLTEKITGKTKDLECTLFEWGRSKEPHDAVYGQIACSDVATWFDDNGLKLFTPNIRSFLGETDVNTGIMESILKQPELFWYVNNGITAICDSYSKKAIGGTTRDSGNFIFENLRVVNGAQTVGSIHTAWKKNNEAVEHARVGIKIISTQKAPLDFENDITKKTNTQNKVEARDFIALDPNQSRIKHELFHMGIEYCYRAGERPNNPRAGLDAQEAAIALACSQSEIKFPVLAKRNIGQLLDPKTVEYKKIFDGTSGELLWGIATKVREIDEKLQEAKKSKQNGREAQLIVHGNRIITHLALKLLKTPRPEFNLDVILTRVIDLAHNYIKDQYKDAYLAVLFKNTDKCAELGTHILISFDD